MIIEGLVLTNHGPVDIKELKVGDMALSHMYKAKTVTAINRFLVGEGYVFKKNPKLMLSKGSIVKTAYGDIRVEKLTTPMHIIMPNGYSLKDSVTKKKEEFYAYEVILDGAYSLYCSNYPLQLEVKK